MFSLFRREGLESKGVELGSTEASGGVVSGGTSSGVGDPLAESVGAESGMELSCGPIESVAACGSTESGGGVREVSGGEVRAGETGWPLEGSRESAVEPAEPIVSSSERVVRFAGAVPRASAGSRAASRPESDGSPVGAAAAGGDWVEEALDVSARVRSRRVRGKRLAKPEADKMRSFSGEQRLLLLDAWRRSGLPAGDFAALVGVSKHTLYVWKKNFEELGPAGLVEQPRGAKAGSRLPEVTRRTILMLKESHPDWGCQRISDMLLRGPALPASPNAVARVLREAGYELVESPTRPHPQPERRFERARPNQLWQTDLFTFVLKRTNRRLYLVAFMDDHSRFLVSYGLHASASTALVLEALEAGISSYGPPEEVLTDNGPQYITWRGKSQFTKRLEQRGIRQIVARPRRPQTLGKVERFWGTLWREFLEAAVFSDLQDARSRIGLFIDHYNFQRTHLGIRGLTPADRFFEASADVARTLKERVAANALELARHGEPKTPFYVTGQMDGQPFSVHSEGPRLILTRPGQVRKEVSLSESPVPLTDVPLAEASPPPASAVEASADKNRLPRPLCPHGAPDDVSLDNRTVNENVPELEELAEPELGDDAFQAEQGGDA